MRTCLKLRSGLCAVAGIVLFGLTTSHPAGATNAAFTSEKFLINEVNTSTQLENGNEVTVAWTIASYVDSVQLCFVPRRCRNTDENDPVNHKKGLHAYVLTYVLENRGSIHITLSVPELTGMAPAACMLRAFSVNLAPGSVKTLRLIALAPPLRKEFGVDTVVYDSHEESWIPVIHDRVSVYMFRAPGIMCD